MQYARGPVELLRPPTSGKHHVKTLALIVAATGAVVVGWVVGPFLPARPVSLTEVPVLGLGFLFVSAAAVVWVAGIHLSDTTNVLSA